MIHYVLMVKKVKYPTKNIQGVKYSNDVYKFKFLRLYYNQMSGFQASIYQKFVNSLNFRYFTNF